MKYVVGSIPSERGPIPLVSSHLGAQDRLGAIGVRLGLARNRYSVAPGLYAVGAPTPDSPVLVSANYKLSFDSLRKELNSLDVWILVLDTKGINVWCSAGKGTFGTKELIHRITMTRLGLVVRHRELILPQLSATGVSAPALRRESGWTAHFGPVLARDLPAYLAAGKNANDAMRKIEFPLLERLKLVPLEILRPSPRFALLLALWCLVALLGRVFLAKTSFSGGPRQAVGTAVALGWHAWLPVISALGIGSGLVPAFLPWLPFRAFSAKGASLGLLFAIGWIAITRSSLAEAIALLLIIPAISAWYALNFTGSSTYTSLAGVKVEVGVARIPILLGIALGLGLRTGLLFGLGT